MEGGLISFAGCDELKACLEACGAMLIEDPTTDAVLLITSTSNSGRAKNIVAAAFGVPRITEAEFNAMIGGKT